MSRDPPAFENADKCRGCGVSFTLFTRKHHCRNCGRTYCGACSQASLPLPHFGLLEPVRCCEPCVQSLKKGPPQQQQRAAAAAAAPAPAAKPVRSSVSEAPATLAPPPAKKVSNCTCNSPLCICAPDPEEKPAPVEARPVAAAAPVKKPQSSPPPATVSTFQGFGGSSRPAVQIDRNGDLNEQLREAVKAGDLSCVQQLLSLGASAKYVDRTGNALAHLAAMFNRFDIVETLAKHGADLWVQNPARETPVDLAPPALQRKMRELQPQA